MAEQPPPYPVEQQAYPPPQGGYPAPQPGYSAPPPDKQVKHTSTSTMIYSLERTCGSLLHVNIVVA